MKNFKFKLLAFFLTLNVFYVFGKKIDNSILVLNDTQLKLVFKEVKKGQFLNLYDENHTMIYSEQINKSGELIKVLDLSYLKNGDYNIELEKDFKILINQIKIKDNKIFLNNFENKTFYKPLIRNKNELVLISKIGFDEEPINVYIYYNEEIIYSESLKSDKIVNRAYRLDKNLIGHYKIIVTSNSKEYTYDFNI